MDLVTLVGARLEHIRNERLPRESLEAKRLARFRRLAAHAKRHSPYYARVIAENGIDPARCAPQDFPVLTKRDVIEHFDQIVTDRRITQKKLFQFLAASTDPLDLFEGRFHVIHTSGSSGEKGIFVYSQADWARGIVQALRVHDIGPRRKRIAFVGSTRGHFAGVSFATSGRRSIGRLFFDVETFEINSPVRSIVEGLNSYQPDILAGYATVLRILAEKQEEGLLEIRPSVVESSGEPISADDRRRIEQAFQVPLVNLYMSTEHMFMGISRSGNDGMVLMEDDLIFELRGDHTCVTNLFNRTLPLIRYRMDDALIPDGGGDGVLPFLRVKNIIGRVENSPVFRDRHGAEECINFHVISGIVAEHLRRFQFCVIDRTSFVFKACSDGELSEAERRKMVSEIERNLRLLLSQKEMDNVSFEIRLVEDLPVDPKTGKFRLIVPLEEKEV